MLYEGKARGSSHRRRRRALHRYKDDATAFNAKKRGSWEGKGKTNATMSAALFEYLETQGVPTHFVEQVDDESITTKKLEMLPVEVIVGTSPPARWRGSWASRRAGSSRPR
jgi:phosphoribosylaminoimidazole-succinocarboxamide synthase